MKKTLVLFICLCVAVFTVMLSACGGSEAETEAGGSLNTDVNTETENLTETAQFAVITEGKTEFRVIRSSAFGSFSDETQTINAFVNTVNEATGADIKLFTDKTADKSGSSFEILVGDTNRALSAKAKEGLSVNEYRILHEGNKIAINGGSFTAVRYGVEYFADTYLSVDKSNEETGIGSLLIPEGLDLKEEYVVKAVLQSNDALPRLIETKFDMDDVVIADIIATEAPYNADPTGKTDSTKAIQTALDDAYKAL